MESGSLLHLALLRKTSKAKKRKIPPKPNPLFANENFTLSGWSIEDIDAIDSKEQPRQFFTPKNPIEDHHEPLSYRKPATQNKVKIRHRSFSFRGSVPKKVEEFTLNMEKQVEKKVTVRPKCSQIEINYINQNKLKENNGRTVVGLKTEKGQPAVSFTKFVSDINIRQKKLFYKF